MQHKHRPHPCEAQAWADLAEAHFGELRERERKWELEQALAWDRHYVPPSSHPARRVWPNVIWFGDYWPRKGKTAVEINTPAAS